MRQILCDSCGEVIDRDIVTGDEQITFVAVATGDKEDARWKEYHRRCARLMTVAAVWASRGLVPL